MAGELTEGRCDFLKKNSSRVPASCWAKRPSEQNKSMADFMEELLSAIGEARRFQAIVSDIDTHTLEAHRIVPEREFVLAGREQHFTGAFDGQKPGIELQREYGTAAFQQNFALFRRQFDDQFGAGHGDRSFSR